MPRALSRKEAGADEKPERCAIWAGSPWVTLRGSGTGRRRQNRSWQTNRTTLPVGSVALVLFPAESTGHTERRRTCAKLLNAAPFCANRSPGNLRGGIFPLRRNGGQGRGNRWASMLLQQSRLCFRPAGVDLPSGAETDHGEPARPRAALAVSPWFFCRRSRPPIRKTAELPNAAPLWASVLRSVLGGVFSFRQNED